LTLQRQNLLSNEEIKQPTRPRIVIEKMADINESDKPEGYLQRKKSDVRENGENDDDDDVVMDREKSPRHNNAAEELVNGSKSPLVPRRLDDTASRPGTATIKDKEEKVEDKQDVLSRPISAMGVADVSAPVVLQNRPSSAMNDDKAEKLATKFSSLDKASRSPSAISISEPAEVIKVSSTSPYRKDTPENVEHNLKTPPKSSDTSRSVTPSRLDAEQEVKTPNKSRSDTPAGLEPPANAERESKSPDKSRATTPASGGLSPSPNAERETLKTPSKTPDRSRSSTPAGAEASSDEAESVKHAEESTLQVKQSSRPASSLGSPNSMKDKSPKSPRSPDEGPKGFDDGQQRSLASSSPQSPKSLRAASAKSAESEKKRTSFVEDAKKAVDIGDKTATSPTSPATSAKTPRAQTPTKLDDGKREKKSSEKKGLCALAHETKYLLNFNLFALRINILVFDLSIPNRFPKTYFQFLIRRN